MYAQKDVDLNLELYYIFLRTLCFFLTSSCVMDAWERGQIFYTCTNPTSFCTAFQTVSLQYLRRLLLDNLRLSLQSEIWDENGMKTDGI